MHSLRDDSRADCIVIPHRWPLTDEQELRCKIANIVDEQNKTIAIKKTFGEYSRLRK